MKLKMPNFSLGFLIPENQSWEIPRRKTTSTYGYYTEKKGVM